MSDEIKNIIEHSGHNLHQQIEQLLTSLGWAVESSKHIIDIDTNIPREADIIAKKEISIFNEWHNKATQSFEIVLCIESRWLKYDIVFYSTNNTDENIKKSLQTVGMNIDNLLENNLKTLHYKNYGCKVANKHSVNNGKDLSDSIYKSVKTILYLNNTTHTKKVIYPIVVCGGNGKLYLSDGTMENSVEKNHIIYSMNYPYYDKNNRHFDPNFYVDIVSFPKLSDLLDCIEKGEIAEIKKQLNFQETIKTRQNQQRNMSKDCYWR